jgi:hypothetical protein
LLSSVSSPPGTERDTAQLRKTPSFRGHESWTNYITISKNLAENLKPLVRRICGKKIRGRNPNVLDSNSRPQRLIRRYPKIQVQHAHKLEDFFFLFWIRADRTNWREGRGTESSHQTQSKKSQNKGAKEGENRKKSEIQSMQESISWIEFATHIT